MDDERRDVLRIEIYDKIGYHLGIDDSDDGACHAKNAAANAVLRLFDREMADAEALAAKVEAAWEWIACTDPYPERNGDHFAELRRALSGPKLDPLAVLQRAARRAKGERDTAALDHCDHCSRPLPHNDAETRACSSNLEESP